MADIAAGDVVALTNYPDQLATVVCATHGGSVDVLFHDKEFHSKWGHNPDGTAPFGFGNFFLVSRPNPHEGADQYYMAVTGEDCG